MSQRTYVVVGGTGGIGLELSRAIAGRGDQVVLTGRDQDRADAAAASVGGDASGLALDLAAPATIAASLASVGRIDGIVLSGVERDVNTARDFSIDLATRSLTIKLVGYIETVHALLDRLTSNVDSGIVVFGGLSAFRPYPGSLDVSLTNGGVEAMVSSLAVELAPVRVNALHPGIIGDSPFWETKKPALDGYRARTPGGELATMEDVVGAALFLLDNRGVSGTSLHVSRATLSA